MTVKPVATAYDSQAIFNDIGGPTANIKGKVKFVPSLSDSSTFKLGYLLEVDVDPIDISKLPQKYRESKQVNDGNISYTVEPLTNVTYQAHIEFTLRDGDGFELRKITGPNFYIHSSEKQNEQSLCDAQLDENLRRRTTQIDAELSVTSCESCTTEK